MNSPAASPSIRRNAQIRHEMLTTFKTSEARRGQFILRYDFISTSKWESSRGHIRPRRQRTSILAAAEVCRSSAIQHYFILMVVSRRRENS